MSPEAISQGNTLPTTHGDVWNFGILVHNVVAPLSFINIKSTTTSSFPKRNNAGKPGKTSTTIPASTCYATSTTQRTSGFKSVSLREKSFAASSSATRETVPELLELESGGGGRGYNYIEVERFQVARALAGGEFVVDSDTLTTATASITSTTGASQGEQQQPHRVVVPLPLWARQVVSCCLVADPSLRPPINTLLRIWDHIATVAENAN
ncbi:hypothetical protein Pelo_18142 [Pelomyxa schiedti]|nr:hypothetical protein Pelo_18142 [Pelomyxa schiedti]